MDINETIVKIQKLGLPLGDCLKISAACWFVVACRNTEKDVYDELVKTYGQQLDELY